jgi:purine-nucleoside phosphorylase
MTEHSPLPTADLDARVADAVREIRKQTQVVPHAGLTLGSGLGGVVDAIDDGVVFPTTGLPHWPRSTVAGHAGRFAVGYWQGVPVAALSGRTHRYEGHDVDRITFALRVMKALGANLLLFTNAVGAMNPEYEPGDIMLATDHLNFIAKRGLFTPDELRERRAGRSRGSYYSPRVQRALIEAALRARVKLHRGVLMGGLGPTYETAAEVRMAAAVGADVACMSTVHEVTVAAELGCETGGLSCVTNKATGMADEPLTHEDVTVVADRVASKLRAILTEFLKAESESL